MKKYFFPKIILVLVFVLVLFDNCKKDFSLNAGWKDIAIVYALLNQSDTIHYIRIEKAYLGNENALLMGRSFDSTNYPKGVLDVKLEEYINNGGSLSLRNSYPLQWDTVRKDSGTFYDKNNPEQTVFKTLQKLNESYTYKLVITNNNTGKIITAQTILISGSEFHITTPSIGEKVNFLSTKNQQAVTYFTASGGRSYQLIIRFHYDEINKSTVVAKAKYFDWVIPSHTLADMSGGQPDGFTYIASQFYFLLGSNLAVNSSLKRKPGKVDFIFYIAGDEFYTYMQVNKPSNSIVQDKPLYTNVSNGYGIFSCRYSTIRSLDLSAKALDSLVLGRYTKKLNFYNPYNP